MELATVISLVHSVLVFIAGERFAVDVCSALDWSYSFLVADQVYVASVPPKSEKNPNPVQHVFSSSSEESSFEIYPDPRGNTLGQGTEITLIIK
jgi:hypothetical protein